MVFTARLGINLSDLDNIEPGLGALILDDPDPEEPPPPDPPPQPPPVLLPNPRGVSTRTRRRISSSAEDGILTKYGLI